MLSASYKRSRCEATQGQKIGVAEWADDHWLRPAPDRALDAGSDARAWIWQQLALDHGVDLPRSTMAAYHDGGERDGQFCVSDLGGPLYAHGEVALVLADLDP